MKIFQPLFTTRVSQMTCSRPAVLLIIVKPGVLFSFSQQEIQQNAKMWNIFFRGIFLNYLWKNLPLILFRYKHSHSLFKLNWDCWIVSFVWWPKPQIKTDEDAHFPSSLHLLNARCVLLGLSLKITYDTLISPTEKIPRLSLEPQKKSERGVCGKHSLG